MPSQDGLFSCKCHEGFVIYIKCPFKFRDQFIKEQINDCDFLEILHGKIHLSQMAVKGTRLTYFIVWTLKDMYFGIIHFSKEHWKNVESDLSMFFKNYLCPILLGTSEKVMFVEIVNVLLNQEEIDENEEEQHNSV